MPRGHQTAVSLFPWAKRFLPALSTQHIVGVDNVEADFFICHVLNPGEWGLALWAFQHIVDRWGGGPHGHGRQCQSVSGLFFFIH